jgi:hypothetical protein
MRLLHIGSMHASQDQQHLRTFVEQICQYKLCINLVFDELTGEY